MSAFALVAALIMGRTSCYKNMVMTIACGYFTAIVLSFCKHFEVNINDGRTIYIRNVILNLKSILGQMVYLSFNA